VVGDLNLTVSADGVVQPINNVEIKSKASGQIEELNFEEGTEVEKGQLLLVLDQRTAKNDYEQAKADLATAEANAQQSVNNLRRVKELYEKKLVSEQEIDQANVDYVRTKAQMVKATAALSTTEERLRDTRIVAPVSGIILSKSVEMGQIISSGVSNVGGGSLLATIADMNTVHVETNVDEVDIGKVLVGQRAKVVADSYPEDTFDGEVVRIAPLGETVQNVTVFKVVVLVQNLGGKLKAGMSASVDIEVVNKTNVLLIPSDAHKDPNSEEGQAMLTLLQQPDSVAASSGHQDASLADGSMPEPGTPEFRERMQNMSDEERSQMRQQMMERFQRMSPEEQAQMRSRFSQGSGGGGGSSGRNHSARSSGQPEVRRRVVMVKEGEDFVPRVIRVGRSNFDHAEVVRGLEEGDELLITTFSRALLYNQQWTDRIRQRSSMGGMGRR
jgi:HlyD family secretion protein